MANSPESRNDEPLSAVILDTLKDGILGATDWTPFYRARIEQVFALALKGSLSETATTLDKVAALLKAQDADLDICSPGNHGGRGEDANRWLVTIMPSDHKNIREFFGDTLEEALRRSTL